MKAADSRPALDRIDLNLFRVFEAVYLEGSLTRAAEILCVSQSAVSHALSRLREQLNDTLFIREPAGVRPTEVAERIWPDIQQSLRMLRGVATAQVDFDPARDVRKITIGMVEEGEALWLPRIVTALRRDAPQVVVRSARLQRGGMRSDLASGRLDCIIDVAQSCPADILHASISQDQLVVMSRSKISLKLADYQAAEHVCVSARRTGRPVEDIALSAAGVYRQVVARCQRYESACGVVAESDLLLTLPGRVASSLGQRFGTHVSALPIPLPPIELRLYWHARRAVDPASEWIRSSVLSAAVT